MPLSVHPPVPYKAAVVATGVVARSKVPVLLLK